MWVGMSSALLAVLSIATLQDHEVSLILMRLFAGLWEWLALDPAKPVNLRLASGEIVQGKMYMVPYHPAVASAWAKAVEVAIAAMLASICICLPLTVWFVTFSRKRGADILSETHERGSVKVERDILTRAINTYNWDRHEKECHARDPAEDPREVLKESLKSRIRRGFHQPYRIAGVPVPWRLEQSHAMFIGTTGSGKTTELKKIVTQARARGHRCVIFDLTGSFVENFYDETTDIILNPMDQRCQPWSIFNDCDTYAELMSAAAALVPSGRGADDDFWQKSARTVFVEMCTKMIKIGVRSNAGLAYYLMHADLKTISKYLEGTIAAPLMSPVAAKLAESIRATFNANGNVLRFLPEPQKGQQGFSINQWMTEGVQEGSILFITSSHPDLVLNRPLLTLWMDLAVNALFRMGRTQNLRTWFLIDEVHALHRLPAIESGLQTARGFGGAFVLGMHSIAALKDTYGEYGATHLISLAGTKLILKGADPETCQRCSEFIGCREVRQMDEAYSFGFDNSRDASTISSRNQIQDLVMSDDIRELPAMDGYVKFPDGFPAARITLAWKDYPERAKGFVRVTDMQAAPYCPTDEEAAAILMHPEDESGPDNSPKRSTDAPDFESSQAAHGTDNLRAELANALLRKTHEADREERKTGEDRPNVCEPDDADERRSGFRFRKSDEPAQRERQRIVLAEARERAVLQPRTTLQQHKQGQRPGTNQSELLRENTRGFGSSANGREGPSLDDDQEPGR
jgi:type IV conjugative transfer system coupling protein TraD